MITKDDILDGNYSDDDLYELLTEIEYLADTIEALSEALDFERGYNNDK